MALVSEVAALLQTERVGETVHAALREVINARKRMLLPDLDLDLTNERLAVDRAGRTFATEPPA